MTIKGVDTSHWNGTVDWKQAADDGIAFAYIKATQGLGEDPAFAASATAAQAAGIITLAYPFLTSYDSEASVDKFKAVVGDMAAVLDWETAGVKDAVVAMWIMGLAGRPTAGYYGIDPPDAITALIATLPRILPEYNLTPRFPAWDGKSPPDWTKNWMIWQQSDRATFAGETGNFDLDLLTDGMSLEQFRNWTKTGSLFLPSQPPQ